jgi:hypothetical protein
MIVPKALQSIFRGTGGRNAIDLPVAGFAAASVAFLAFAMPTQLMTDLVAASGLPSILAAAEPPLGMKARVGVGLIGAAAMFAFVFTLLRLLDRTGYDSPRPKAAPAPAPVEEAPRARRRDAHPDAPAPRPICAAREFGEPAPPVMPTRAPVSEAPEPLVAPEPEAEPQAPPAPVAERPASLAVLMARLEEGLQRRRVGPAAARPDVAPRVFPEANDDRLQSAIDSLQRLTARQS